MKSIRHACTSNPFLISIAALGISQATSSVAAPILEEVIVTAEKREQLLQDVPISITAFNNDALAKLGVYDIKGLASKIPNVVINEFTGASTTIRLFIRGVGQNDVQVTQDPSVALYMDGVYVGSSVGTAFETADIERVEVLRGPQGTLYGRNATGGALNIITKRADPDAFAFQQSITAGNFDTFRTRTIVNLPISDSAAIKFAYSQSDRDGIVKNIGNGLDWGIEERSNFTADFHWDAGDSVALDYKFEHSTIEDTSRLSQLLKFDADAPSAGVPTFANPALNPDGSPVEASRDRLDKATAFDRQERGDNTIDAHTLSVAWDIDSDFSVKSITGYRELDAFSQNAQTPTTSLFGTYSITNGKPTTAYEQFSQEFQVLYEGDAITWVGGLYYYTDEADEDSGGASNGSEAIPEGVLRDFTSTENESLAAYGQITWSPQQLDNRWHFTLGARYSEDSRKAFRDNNRVSFGFAGSPTTVPAFIDNYDQEFSKFNPSITIGFDLNDDANLYAKNVTAYKSGGSSQRSTSSSNFRGGFYEEHLVS